MPKLTSSTLFSRDKFELQANTFAVELLLPDDLLREYPECSIQQLANSVGSPVLHDILDSVHKLSSMDEQTQLKQLPVFLKAFEQKLHRRIDPLIAFAEKMNKGSIVDTHQIVTVSKQRIITPTKRNDHLYDICIPPDIMSDICKMIHQNYIEAERLDKPF